MGLILLKGFPKNAFVVHLSLITSLNVLLDMYLNHVLFFIKLYERVNWLFYFCYNIKTPIVIAILPPIFKQLKLDYPFIFWIMHAQY